MNDLANELLEFINESPTSYHATRNWRNRRGRL